MKHSAIGFFAPKKSAKTTQKTLQNCLIICSQKNHHIQPKAGFFKSKPSKSTTKMSNNLLSKKIIISGRRPVFSKVGLQINYHIRPKAGNFKNKADFEPS